MNTLDVPPFLGYESKTSLLARFCTDKQVLHLGAVGATCEDTAAKVGHGPASVHAFLSRISTCVGVDTDALAVRELIEAGIFDNLIVADAEKLTRDSIPLDAIEVIVAGDIIEHLSDPAGMLEGLLALSEPDTKLIVTTPNALGLPNYLRYLRGRALEGGDHVFSFNRFTLSNLLRRHGWNPQQLYACHQPPARRESGRLAFWVGRRLFRWQPRLGGTLFQVATPADRGLPSTTDSNARK